MPLEEAQVSYEYTSKRMRDKVLEALPDYPESLPFPALVEKVLGINEVTQPRQQRTAFHRLLTKMQEDGLVGREYGSGRGWWKSVQ